MLEDEANALCADIAAKLGWEKDYYQISAFQKLNVDVLCQDIMEFIDSLPPEEEMFNKDEEMTFTWNTNREEAVSEVQNDDSDADADLDDEDWDDDDYDVEVIYQK
jgi:GTP-binding protein